MEFCIKKDRHHVRMITDTDMSLMVVKDIKGETFHSILRYNQTAHISRKISIISTMA